MKFECMRLEKRYDEKEKKIWGNKERTKREGSKERSEKRVSKAGYVQIYLRIFALLWDTLRYLAVPGTLICRPCCRTYTIILTNPHLIRNTTRHS